MNASEKITSLIPHREPFLWVDKIISTSETQIVTEKRISPELELFNGHYPDNPIMPGVLLCEAIFQSGAILMSKSISSTKQEDQKVPVLTRIKNAKFKHSVRPGDVAQINVQLIEVISSASFFKGTLRVGGKVAVKVEFACALAETNNK